MGSSLVRLSCNKSLDMSKFMRLLDSVDDRVWYCLD